MSTYLVIVFVVGIGTYLTRLSFVATFARSGVPPWLEAPLRYVAPAVLAALVAPAVIAPDGIVDVSTGNPRFFAGLTALVVALWTKSVPWTILAGMASLWVFQALL